MLLCRASGRFWQRPGSRSGRPRVDSTKWPPCSVGMGGDLLASTGETASCGTTTIQVPDAGWCRQRERPGVPTSAARPGAQTFRASGQAPGGLSVPRHSWDAWDRCWLPTEGARGGLGRRLPAAAPVDHARSTREPVYRLLLCRAPPHVPRRSSGVSSTHLRCFWTPYPQNFVFLAT